MEGFAEGGFGRHSQTGGVHRDRALWALSGEYHPQMEVLADGLAGRAGIRGRRSLQKEIIRRERLLPKEIAVEGDCCRSLAARGAGRWKNKQGETPCRWWVSGMKRAGCCKLFVAGDCP